MECNFLSFTNHRIDDVIDFQAHKLLNTIPQVLRHEETNHRLLQSEEIHLKTKQIHFSDLFGYLFILRLNLDMLLVLSVESDIKLLIAVREIIDYN